MRKIERAMIDAIQRNANWRSDNTKVMVYPGVARVFLHGNHIADVCTETYRPTPNLDTLRSWPTPTTKSRLRALGVNVTQKNHEVFVDDVRVT